ncbi:unnamed protein product [Nezara viridula]|uniref:Uncharacterized protein n=1 Tax=Nezara viridula TaxID=85310 RepID=A0A9P0ED57_NEZVI|nr:unnamed protein product [Nezara viridula]
MGGGGGGGWMLNGANGEGGPYSTLGTHCRNCRSYPTTLPSRQIGWVPWIKGAVLWLSEMKGAAACHRSRLLSPLIGIGSAYHLFVFQPTLNL